MIIRSRLPRSAFTAGTVLLWVHVGLLAAQNTSGTSYSLSSLAAGAPNSATSAPRTISGRVINALTGTPVPRALVSLNSRAVLTDSQGLFAFTDFSDANAFAQITKPGYSASATPETGRMQRIVDLDSPVELKLYPDALLTGVVSGPDGLPLARIRVQLRRLTFDASGAHWSGSAATQTNVHGEYRFNTPAGHYRISTGYTARSVERGEAVLPVTFPAPTAINAESLDLAFGEQRQVDLRPRVGPSFPVQLTLDGAVADRGARITAAGASGVGFQLASQREGDVLSTQLPVGTFLLRATSGDRDNALSGESRVTVTGRNPAQTTLHLIPAPSFLVEAAFEPVPSANATATPTSPSIQQFNLSLHNLADGGDGTESDARLTVRPDRSAQFQVQPGRYRLNGSSSGGWYIRTANCGVTDLMTEDLVVASSSAGSPIHLVISNETGRLKGAVTTAGRPASGWVYLVPQQPSLISYVEVYIQSDGSYQWSGAPGRYLVVPSQQQVREDFRNAVFLRRFSTAGKEVEVTAGTDTTADLTLVPVGLAP